MPKKSTANSTTGQRLKALRDKRDLTQIELADRAGIGVSSVRRLETDEGDPSPKLLKKLGAYFGVNWKDLL